jgi:phage shock protein E
MESKKTMLTSLRFLLAISTVLLSSNRADAFAPAPINFVSTRRPFVIALTTVMAAPGVVVAPPDEIREALANPNTIVLDVRGVDEIKKDGLFKTSNHQQWIHAQCTLDECPLLSVAADSLMRDKSATILVYCASGKRAVKAKQVLESLGYTHVLNGGSLADMSSFA